MSQTATGKFLLSLNVGRITLYLLAVIAGVASFSRAFLSRRSTTSDRRTMGKASKQKQSARHDPLVDAKASRKILELARRQQAELDDEAGITPPQPGYGLLLVPRRDHPLLTPCTVPRDRALQMNSFPTMTTCTRTTRTLTKRRKRSVLITSKGSPWLTSCAWQLEDDDAFDDAAFSGVSGRLQPGQNLADLILAKIQEQQALANAPAPAPAAPSTPDVPPALNDKVVEVYTKCALSPRPPLAG